MESFHKRLQVYSKPTAKGGVKVDIETMLLDVIAIAKCGGITEQMLHAKIREMFPDVEVEMDLPKGSKN